MDLEGLKGELVWWWHWPANRPERVIGTIVGGVLQPLPSGGAPQLHVIVDVHGQNAQVPQYVGDWVERAKCDPHGSQYQTVPLHSVYRVDLVHVGGEKRAGAVDT